MITANQNNNSNEGTFVSRVVVQLNTKGKYSVYYHLIVLIILLIIIRRD